MKRFLHYIDDDLEEENGVPLWQRVSFSKGLRRLCDTLANYAEFEHGWPEEKNEAND